MAESQPLESVRPIYYRNDFTELIVVAEEEWHSRRWEDEIRLPFP